MSIIKDTELDALIAQQKQIEEQQNTLKEKIAAKQLELKKSTLNSIFETMRSYSISISDLEKELPSDLKSGKDKKKSVTTGRSVVKAKYQNPNNPNEVWSGRGIQSAWVKNYIAAGGTLEELEIK